MIHAGTITSLVNQEREIFAEARKLAYKKGLVLSSGIILTQDCKTSPLCKHCSWRSRRHVVRENTPTGVEDVIARSLHIQHSGVDRIMLISGWMGNALPSYFFDYIEAVKKNTQLDITTTFGAISKTELVRLKEIGVDRINCGLETTNPVVFS
jgi:biotin synthase-like enzyme